MILGIDPGSRVTGYGLIQSQGNRLIYVDAGPVRFKGEEPIGARLVRLVEQLERVIAQYKPGAVAIEKVFHAVNVKSTLMLGYMRGAALYVAYKHGIPTFEYAATEVKVAVTGYGRADKSQVQEMVRMLLGLAKAPKPHDVSDALAVAICHAHSHVAPRWRRT